MDRFETFHYRDLLVGGRYRKSGVDPFATLPEWNIALITQSVYYIYVINIINIIL